MSTGNTLSGISAMEKRYQGKWNPDILTGYCWLDHHRDAPQSTVVYYLQRRVRNLRDQLQRRDLHLDLLRRKVALREDCTRMRSLLEAECDDANLRVKKLNKQLDKLQLQLAESRSLSTDLKVQLTEACDYKIIIKNDSLGNRKENK
ncbi:coiled-coil domain-containing protein 170-like [Lycorma delicatula]|uniref:coiled-coil domain-containing protein 170-like n=1 Tax=Lycorma delicatula TaxID=130591 RepID=UPI003F50F20A